MMRGLETARRRIGDELAGDRLGHPLRRPEVDDALMLGPGGVPTGADQHRQRGEHHDESDQNASDA
jgi:hypothetical protein